MANLEMSLKTKLKNARRVLILGVGAELRADDAAGLICAQSIGKAVKGKKTKARIKVLLGSTAPENLTGQIKDFAPTHLIIIDAADLQTKPGTIRILPREDINNASFSTHRMPLKIMLSYLDHFLKCEMIVIGIQPKSTEYTASCSPIVDKSVKQLAKIISGLI